MINDLCLDIRYAIWLQVLKVAVTQQWMVIYFHICPMNEWQFMQMANTVKIVTW